MYLLEDFPQPQQKVLLREARNLYSDIKVTIDTRLDLATGHLVKLKTISNSIILFNRLYKNNKKMAAPKVDLKM